MPFKFQKDFKKNELINSEILKNNNASIRIELKNHWIVTVRFLNWRFPCLQFEKSSYYLYLFDHDS